MKQKKWSVCQDNPIGRISEFIKKYLKLDPNERLVRRTFLSDLLCQLGDNNEFLSFSFSMSIRRSHPLPIRRSRTCTTAMVQTENWSYITVKVKRGAEIRLS